MFIVVVDFVINSVWKLLDTSQDGSSLGLFNQGNFNFEFYSRHGCIYVHIFTYFCVVLCKGRPYDGPINFL